MAIGFMRGDICRNRFPQLYNNSHDYRHPLSSRAFRSDHPAGVQFTLLDGSVRSVGSATDPACVAPLVTRAGEEVLPDSLE